MTSATSKQLPQLAPQPVRIVSSATLLQPLVAASRIWWSVTPLQMQTYTKTTHRNKQDRLNDIQPQMRMIVNF